MGEKKLMPYIVRNDKGEICGRCTNKPGLNKLPSGAAEVVEFIEDDTPEVLAFVEAQRARIAAEQSKPSAVAVLRAELVEKGVLTAAAQPA